MTERRRRGAAIIKSRKGILLVGGRNRYYLPGGGAEKGESRRKAALRETTEETTLEPTEEKFLFSYKGIRKKKYGSGKQFRDHTKVFLVKTKGKPKPTHEIRKVAHWKKGSQLPIDEDTSRILKRYLMG